MGFPLSHRDILISTYKNGIRESKLAWLIESLVLAFEIR